MRRIRIKQETVSVWAGHVAVASVLVLGFMLAGCKVAGVDGKVSLGNGSAADTQATLGSTVSPTATTRRVVTGPVAFEDAETAYHAGRYGEAVDLFGAYVEQKPANAWGHYMLGLSAWKAGETKRAESALIRSLEIDSSHVKSWVNLSRVLLDDGRPDEALERLQQAVELDSTSSEVYRLIGRARSHRGQLDDAIVAYRWAIALDDQDGWALNNLGVLYIEQDQPEAAVGPLARAVEVRPAVAVFHNNLGMALELVGYFGAAVDQYRLALEADSTHELAAANLSRIDGREDGPDLPLLDLPALGREFLQGIRPVPQDTTLRLTIGRS